MERRGIEWGLMVQSNATQPDHFCRGEKCPICKLRGERCPRCGLPFDSALQTDPLCECDVI